LIDSVVVIRSTLASLWRQYGCAGWQWQPQCGRV
jgi:hypothetical protein